ncbi:MAG: hypothetical protein WC681_24035 [Sterolibacterium sp.]|jgi:hypothetical protein
MRALVFGNGQYCLKRTSCKRVATAGIRRHFGLAAAGAGGSGELWRE